MATEREPFVGQGAEDEGGRWNGATPSAEHERLTEAQKQNVPWMKWGPYLSERQWGTVREDYSADGAAWDYFTHDQARSRAYRWGTIPFCSKGLLPN